VSIVFLSPTGQVGGGEAALVDLLAGLRAAHPTWPLRLVVASDGPLAARAEALGVPVETLAFPRALSRLGDWSLGPGTGARLLFLWRCAVAQGPALAYLFRLRRRLRALAPAVVHTNGLKMHLLGAWASPRASAVVWHLHDYVGRRAAASWLLRWSAGRCAAIVANSRSVAEDARGTLADGPPVHAIWNAVDLQRFSPSGPGLDLDARAGLPPAGDVLRVGLVATFAAWKGHGVFLDALAMLAPGLSVRGYVVGGPIYDTTDSQATLHALRARAEALGIADRVGFTGFVDDTSCAMRALDIVVHASTEPEPFGLVIAEAMACGRPVIVSGAGGARELAECGTDVPTVPPGDAGALAREIESLATDPSRRDRLGREGRRTAERCFAISRMAGELTALYRALPTVH
jgi:glycosyltransferase involved in cell wall biosynthesis